MTENVVEREIAAAGGEIGLTVVEEGPLAIWTIARPDRRNALSRSVVRELGRVARETATRKDLRCVILHGEGTQAFCAGADLKERNGMHMEEVRDFLNLYQTVFGEIDRLPIPIVAAIDGVAFGGGLELALACDLRVASRTATLGLTETSLGIIPGAGGTQRLTRELGAGRAKDLILFARRLDAEEAYQLGLLQCLANVGEDALSAARRYVAPLLEAAPIAIAAALSAIDSALDEPLAAGLVSERRAYDRTLVSQDRVEALKAFAEKRKPVFQGK